jgi:curved DNA-binding protein CbpA
MAVSRSEPRSDPYAILGVDRAATAAEIRAAYRAQVARYHPDRHQGNPLEDLASERMVEINQAYELLSDPDRRAAFDQRRSDAGAGAAAERGRGGARGAGGDGGATRSPRPRMHPLAKWGLLVLALPVLVRSGAGLLRAVVGLLEALLRGLFGALGGFRGTPAGLAIVVLAAALLGVALWRRQRRRGR